MTNIDREAYRERLSKGDIVYFVEGSSAMGGGDLVVKKGTIATDDMSKRYPSVVLWSAVDKDPHGTGIAVSKSPRDVFTPQEVFRLVEHHDPSLLATTSIIDEMLVDPIASREIVPILGGAAIQRLADDELRNPGDPEY